MKTTKMKDGRIIKSSWFNTDEAAAYCGLSRTTFIDHARDLPHEGDSATRLYCVEVLDAWIRGELDIPFSPGDENEDDL